ncbi:hypothetical protein VTO42DRAFT_8442 [Malbranchea cinnamomea]
MDWNPNFHAKKYGILPEDISNFDEVGFLMGIIATTRVVTGSEKNLCPNLIQPGNQEWITVIQGVNASGWFLPPMFILKGKNHQASWYQTKGLPDRGVTIISENGGSLPPQYSDAYTNPSRDFSYLSSFLGYGHTT